MRPLAGTVVGKGSGTVTVETESGNTITVQTKKKFKFGQAVRINFNYKAKTVRSIEAASKCPQGTEVCQNCSHTSLNLGDDTPEDIY